MLIFSGASWGATVSSPARLRWSRNLKRDSRTCKNTSDPTQETKTVSQGAVFRERGSQARQKSRKGENPVKRASQRCCSFI